MTHAPDATPLLQARGVDKIFPGVRALDGVDFTLRGGEIHALLGENGAGKSTLIKVITGVLRRDEGDLFLNGQQIDPHAPAARFRPARAGRSPGRPGAGCRRRAAARR